MFKVKVHQNPLFACGITVCRVQVPGGRRFLCITDDFGDMVEVEREDMPAFTNEH